MSSTLIEDSSWLRVQDREILSERELKHRATKERGFQEHARKRLPDLHEVDMINPISFFVEVDLFLNYLFCIKTDVLIIFSPKSTSSHLASQSGAR